MYVIIGIVVALLLLWLGLFLGESVAIKNGLIIRLIPEDEYFKLMRIQKKMSVST